MKNLKLKDIASALNISIAAVSKSLKNYPDVSPKTRERVRAYAKSVNFSPNSQAAFLRTRETKLIGVIVSQLTHYFFSTILSTIIEEAEANGYLVIVLPSEESVEIEKKHIATLLQKHVDGIFLTLAKDTYDFEHLNQIVESGTSLILFDNISKVVPCSKVVIDDRQAAFMATEYLIKKGKKRIAHCRGPLIPQLSIDRFIGYKRALEKYHIEYDPELVFVCDKINEEEGYEAAQKIIDMPLEIDALFAASDLTAIGAMHCFQKNGFHVPKDIAIVGFSNWKVSSLTTPLLTTVDQPGDVIGKEVMALFLKEQAQKKAKETIEHQTVTVPTKLIERESS